MSVSLARRTEVSLPLHQLDASHLAALVREKRLSSVELVTHHLRRIEALNPALNALVTLDAERALERARAADAALARGESWGPLHGVPFTAKDLLETEGVRTTGGSRLWARHVPSRDATFVARMKAAGAILLGKTNLPELGSDVQCRSPVFGRSNNPWDLERTPGGSTGGGAAAVAAGLSPLELGSDLGGSVRIPAHFCGVYGFKPTEHRISTAGHLQASPGREGSIRHALCVGPLARSVADLRLAFELAAGPDGRQFEVTPVPLDEAPPRALSGLRVAWSTDVGGVPVSDDTRAVVESLAQRLAAAGARVERREPPGLDWRAAWEHWAGLGWAEGLAMSPRFYAWAMRLVGGLLGPMARSMSRAASLDLRRQMVSLAVRDRLISSLETFLSDWDVWLLPVSMTSAFRHQRTYAPIPVDGVKRDYLLASVGATCVFNVTGHPVVALPAGASREGLPIGVQLVGRRWADRALLSAAEAVAGLTEGFRPPPELPV